MRMIDNDIEESQEEIMQKYLQGKHHETLRNLENELRRENPYTTFDWVISIPQEKESLFLNIEDLFKVFKPHRYDLDLIFSLVDITSLNITETNDVRIYKGAILKSLIFSFKDFTPYVLDKMGEANETTTRLDSLLHIHEEPSDSGFVTEQEEIMLSYLVDSYKGMIASTRETISKREDNPPMDWMVSFPQEKDSYCLNLVDLFKAFKPHHNRIALTISLVNLATLKLTMVNEVRVYTPEVITNLTFDMASLSDYVHSLIKEVREQANIATNQDIFNLEDIEEVNTEEINELISNIVTISEEPDVADSISFGKIGMLDELTELIVELNQLASKGTITQSHLVIHKTEKMANLVSKLKINSN